MGRRAQSAHIRGKSDMLRDQFLDSRVRCWVPNQLILTQPLISISCAFNLLTKSNQSRIWLHLVIKWVILYLMWDPSELKEKLRCRGANHGISNIGMRAPFLLVWAFFRMCGFLSYLSGLSFSACKLSWVLAPLATLPKKKYARISTGENNPPNQLKNA